MSISDVSPAGEPVDPKATAIDSAATTVAPDTATDPAAPKAPETAPGATAIDATELPNSFDAAEASAAANKLQLEQASVVGAGSPDTAPGEPDAAQPVPGVPPESVPAGEAIPDLPPIPPAETSTEGLAPAEQGEAGMPPLGVDPGATLGEVGDPAVPPDDVETAPVSAPAAFATAGVADTSPGATSVDPPVAEPGGVTPPASSSSLEDVAKKAELPADFIAQVYAISNAEVAAGDLHAQNAEIAAAQRAGAPPNASSTTAVRPPISSPASDEEAEKPVSDIETTEPEQAQTDPKGAALSVLSEAATALHGAIDDLFNKTDAEIEPLGEHLRIGAEAIVTQLGGASPELKPFTNIMVGASDPLMKNVESVFDEKAHAALALFQARIESLPFFK